MANVYRNILKLNFTKKKNETKCLFGWLVGGGCFLDAKLWELLSAVNRNGGSSAALKLCRGSLRAYEDGN